MESMDINDRILEKRLAEVKRLFIKMNELVIEKDIKIDNSEVVFEDMWKMIECSPRKIVKKFDCMIRGVGDEKLTMLWRDFIHELGNYKQLEFFLTSGVFE